MFDIKIIDNYLSKREHQSILKFVCSSEMTWNYGNVLPVEESEDGSYSLSEKTPSKYNFQNYHIIYDRVLYTQFYKEIAGPVLGKLNPDALVKVKLNLTHCSEKVMEHGFHCDNNYKNCKTAIYYINDNDGYTIFEDGKKVESISNRLVMFPTYIKHSGTTCTDSNARIVLNINYFKD